MFLSDDLGTTRNFGTFAAGTELLFRIEVTDSGYSFFTGGAAHARVENDWMAEGTTLVSSEDLSNGPFDYNDLSFSFTHTVGALERPAVPLPAAAPLLIGAFAGLAGFRRRTRKA